MQMRYLSAGISHPLRTSTKYKVQLIVLNCTSGRLGCDFPDRQPRKEGLASPLLLPAWLGCIYWPCSTLDWTCPAHGGQKPRTHPAVEPDVEGGRDLLGKGGGVREARLDVSLEKTRVRAKDASPRETCGVGTVKVTPGLDMAGRCDSGAVAPLPNVTLPRNNLEIRPCSQRSQDVRRMLVAPAKRLGGRTLSRSKRGPATR